MLSFFILLAFSVICTEAITEIVVKSLAFKPIRDKLDSSSKVPVFIKYLKSCPHCFSMWAAMIPAYTLFIKHSFDFLYPAPKIFILFFLSILIHRLSNYLHMCIDRVDKFYIFKLKKE